MSLSLIQKIALDKLATRVHSMYGKVFDAAMLSVQPTQTDVGRKEISLFSSFDSKFHLPLKGNGYTLRGGNSFKIVLLPSEMVSTLKGKNLLPLGAKSFFLE